jgi:hypothetical protein
LFFLPKPCSHLPELASWRFSLRKEYTKNVPIGAPFRNIVTCSMGNPEGRLVRLLEVRLCHDMLSDIHTDASFQLVADYFQRKRKIPTIDIDSILRQKSYWISKKKITRREIRSTPNSTQLQASVTENADPPPSVAGPTGAFL